jgi:DNA-binding MarR family transcriptional regulator
MVQSLRESSRLAETRVGLSGAQLFVLQKLDEAPNASINELAEKTHTHQSSVSSVVARLVARGLVRRAQSGVDGRRLELSLSPNGRRLVHRGPDVAQDALIRAVEALPVSRRRTLAASLGALAQAIDRSHRAPAMFFEDRHRSRRKPHA